MAPVPRMAVALLLLALLCVGVAADRSQRRRPQHNEPGSVTQGASTHAAEEGARAHAAKAEVISQLEKNRSTAKLGPRHMRVPKEDIIELTPVKGSNQQARVQGPAADGFVLHPVQVNPKPGGPSGLNFTTFVYPTSAGPVTIYVGITSYPLGKFHIFPAPRNADENANLAALHASRQSKRQWMSPMAVAAAQLDQAPRNSECDGVAETSVSAQHYGCEFAQNAGFFNMQTGGCMGDVVSNGVHINTATPDLQGHAHFGVTKNGNFVTGYLTAAQVSAGVDGGFRELVTGAGWLIREGEQYINKSYIIEGLGEGFVEEIAPRNALGHDKYGRLLQFEADGEEDIKLGLSLWEFTTILSEHFNVVNAINMDGGGSSTTVYNGAVVDHPTCHDTPVECERSVTTISCVLP